MKPIRINLVQKANIWSRLAVALIALLACATCAVSLMNTLDYYYNTKEIKVYERRVEQMNRQAKRKSASQKVSTVDADVRQYARDKEALMPLIEKSVFPLMDFLSLIETLRPDKVQIASLVFSKDMKSTTIVGQSGSSTDVSTFISRLKNSEKLRVRLEREEVKKGSWIEFELNARWKGHGNG